VRAFVALGSNVGERDAHLAYARRRLASLPATRLVAVSAVEETAPLGPIPQGPYLNQMALLETELTPSALLAWCRTIERERGRTRETPWGPRTLDLDLVRFGDHRIADPELVVPHPQLPHRAFWQRELAELEARAAARD